MQDTGSSLDAKQSLREKKKKKKEIGATVHKADIAEKRILQISILSTQEPWNDNSVLFCIVSKLHNNTYTI